MGPSPKFSSADSDPADRDESTAPVDHRHHRHMLVPRRPSVVPRAAPATKSPQRSNRRIPPHRSQRVIERTPSKLPDQQGQDQPPGLRKYRDGRRRHCISDSIVPASTTNARRWSPRHAHGYASCPSSDPARQTPLSPAALNTCRRLFPYSQPPDRHCRTTRGHGTDLPGSPGSPDRPQQPAVEVVHGDPMIARVDHIQNPRRVDHSPAAAKMPCSLP
jgi:hypothetical protein